MLRRIVGNARQHDAEEIEFWRNASQALRAETLYRLLARGRALREAGVPDLTDDSQIMILYPDHVEIRPRP
jgi:hypothetical protein